MSEGIEIDFSALGAVTVGYPRILTFLQNPWPCVPKDAVALSAETRSRSETWLMGYSLFVRPWTGTLAGRPGLRKRFLSRVQRSRFAQGTLRYDNVIDGRRFGHSTMMAAHIVVFFGQGDCQRPDGQESSLLYLGIERAFSGRAERVSFPGSNRGRLDHHRSEHVECARPKRPIATPAIVVCANADAGLKCCWLGHCRFEVEDGFTEGHPKSSHGEGPATCLQGSTQDRDRIPPHGHA
ncbi:MAG: hypothetical protein IPF61_03750 [Xanthomonadales bacterium]|nr:hypothetical protein [Xanthomonadales bacterium]